MKVEIEDGCVGCGMCVALCPKVFALDDDGYAMVLKQPDDAEKECVLDAQSQCPVEVIKVEE